MRGETPPRPGIIGVTGGIGTGKSTLSGLLAAETGWPVLDADRLGHEALRAGAEPLSRLVSRFGNGLLQANGDLDRTRLAALVFQDPEALADLNGIVHPYILDRIDAEVARLQEDGRTDIIVIDAALLLDWLGRIRPDWVVVVTAPIFQRLKRLAARGVSRKEALRRIRNQRSLAEETEQAQWVVKNDGGVEALAERAQELVREIRRLRAGSAPSNRT